MTEGIQRIASRVSAYARERGIPVEGVETWETDPPSPERLVEITEILGITLDTLFDPYQLEPGEAQWSFRVHEGEPDED